MKTILEDLWNGRISPWEGRGRFEKEINELSAYIERHEKKLSDLAQSGVQEALAALDDCFTELCDYERLEAFESGFSLGVKLTVAALSK